MDYFTTVHMVAKDYQALFKIFLLVVKLLAILKQNKDENYTEETISFQTLLT